MRQSEAETLVELVKKKLKERIDSEIYEMWFASLEAVPSALEGRLVLSVLNDFHEMWLRDNYSELFQEIILQCAKVRLEIEFVARDNSKKMPSQKPESSENLNSRGGSRDGSRDGSKLNSRLNSKGDSQLNSKDDSRGDSKGDSRDDSRGDSRDGSKLNSRGDSRLNSKPNSRGDSTFNSKGISKFNSQFPFATRSKKRGEAMFNPNYTFGTLVVAKSNEMAHGAAIGVAQAPGKSHNPLFIYGSVGLGKTHLLHAIGQYVAEHRHRANIAYVSCEKFTNEFIERLGNNQLPRFRKRYRQTDVLLIDDVQFLSGKKQTQEEFFHTFNALHEAHRQIVITCDRPACEIAKLEERLISRFEWGLMADLQPPDTETRLAILRRKARSLNAELPPGILEFLSERIRANVRRLEGALIRVVSYKRLPQILGHKDRENRELTTEIVEDLLRDILQEEGKNCVTIEIIQKQVAAHFDIRVADMSSRRRPENIVFPRQVAMFLSRDLTNNSFAAIGESFGGRDHGTVIHACRVIENRMDTDQKVRQDVSYLKRHIQR